MSKLRPYTNASFVPYRCETLPFTAADGVVCNVVHVRGKDKPWKGPVMLVHGAGVRANLFHAPVQVSFIDSLIQAGYDVWLENWRASIDLPPRRWTLDEAAAFDHPEAVRLIARETGEPQIAAVIHCQGSTSFMMSAVAGLLPQVKVIVSNAVSLHPVVPLLSRGKLAAAVPCVNMITDFLNPQWGIHAPTVPAKMISMFVALTHHECDNPVCKQVSFTYGSGFPALWSHANLNEATHDWIKGEFAAVPLTFFRQMARCVSRGHLVSVSTLPGLLSEYGVGRPKTDAKITFLAGKRNHCFLAESQVRTYQYFTQFGPGQYGLHQFDDYGHLDVFIGKNASRDVFPKILQALDLSTT